ncbi:MAG: CoA transferase subunit A [Oscillospiraceae bacterium]|nr:CoA transferase subunit A [Oscillospiraceae bacterium]
MGKITTFEEAIDHIQSGMTVMIGGFFLAGCPFGLVKELTRRGGKLENISLISNDAASEFKMPHAYGNELIATGMVKKVTCAFIGHNHVAMKKIADGELELEMQPMGTFAERIRIGGAGIGGFLTPTGVGTPIAEGKPVINVDGVDYILEKPLKADVALIYGSVADENGNIYTTGVARNFNVDMATAAKYTVAEVRKIVKPGEIDPSMVTIPAPFIDAIVLAKEEDYLL